MDYVPARKVNYQDFRRQYDLAYFNRGRSQIDQQLFAAPALKCELMMESEMVTSYVIPARFGASPALTCAWLRDEVEGGPSARRHEKNASQRDRLTVTDTGLHPPRTINEQRT